MSTKEAMDVGTTTSRRRSIVPKAGSVWETRMKSDQVKGGIKVYDAADENSDEKLNVSNDSSPKPKRSPVGAGGKRKTWKSESLEGSPLQIVRQRSELGKNFDEQSKQISVSVSVDANGNGLKKSPVQMNKTRSGDVIQNNLASKSRKVKSDSNEIKSGTKLKSESTDENGNVKNSAKLELVKANTVVSDKPNEIMGLDDSSEEIDENAIGIDRSGSDQDCKELVVFEEKAITSISNNAEKVFDDDLVDGEEDDEQWDDEKEEEEIDTAKEQSTKKIVIEEKKLVRANEKPVPISPIVKKQSLPPVNHSRKIHTSPTKTKPIPVSDDFQRPPSSHSKLQSFVDLVMWRDVSKSAFIFGIGTFAIVSSSYTKDLNISFISVLSYLGLVYLASIFLFRSLISRGEIDTSQDYVVGEDEAIWLIKLILPFINEFLLKLRALFSGDPSTTMKLAVLLFVLARCGSSITIWKMAKLGFFGVFIVPKVCSSYSTQLTAYGTFWIQRFRDAWQSCSHKKAVGFAIFTLVWNLSSMVARIWAVFMLFVAFKYYQHSLVCNEWTEEEVRHEDSWQGRRQGRVNTSTHIRKQKKEF